MTRTEVIQKAIKAAKAAGEWNQESSVNCIMALVENESGGMPDEEFKGFVNDLVNPSAFRQRLEKKGILPKGTERAKSKLDALLNAI